MALGARARFDSDLAVSVTGIAGPDGGTPEKPVGTVYFALASREGALIGKKRLFIGERTAIRRAASIQALELVRRHLTGAEEGP
jgi:nicotinamide-nucleotide amidase